MNRFFALVALSVLPLLAQQDAAPLREGQPALITVIAYDAQGKELRKGVGFFVSKDGAFVTSRRVLEGAFSAEITAAKDVRYAVKGVASESVSAGFVRGVIELREEEVKFVGISGSVPEVGGTVVVCATSAEGVVSAVRDVPGLGKVLRITASVSPEASGGPVINTKGEVIGVAMWQASEPKNVSFAASGESLLAIRTGPLKTLVEWNKASPPAVAESDYREGLNRLFLGDFEGALSRFELAIEKDARYAEAWYHAGFVKGKLGRQKEKIEAYQEAVCIKPNYAAAHYSLGVSYALIGEGELALEEYKILITLDPDMAEGLEMLIHFTSHEGHPPEETKLPGELL